MSQKTVILCEGDHDLSLISILLEEEDKKVSVKNWDQIQRASKYTGESTVISKFKSSKGRNFSFLVKQDRNIDTCIESFWTLYRDFEGYSLKMVIDSDGEGGVRKVRDSMMRLISRDVIQSETTSSNIFYFKDGSGKPAVFLYPCTESVPTGKLTDLVKEAGCGNLAGCRDFDERKEIIKRYLATNPSWILDLKNFLLG